MNKIWAILFLLVPILGVLCFALGPAYNIWLPEDISEHGHVIDQLYYFILYLTGIVFIGTEFVLAWFLFRYDGKTNRSPVKFTHGSHNLEVVWTIIPAATLLFIAIFQMNAWAEAKIFPPNITPTVEVTARQFEWGIRYPRTTLPEAPPQELADPHSVVVSGEHGTRYTYGKDDVRVTNDLRLPLNQEVLIELKTSDVLHSFFLPNLRVKQDAVPGMKIPVWFKAKKVGQYDLVCAELCGWGHYKMKGQLTVMPPAEFEAWLDEKKRELEATR